MEEPQPVSAPEPSLAAVNEDPQEEEQPNSAPKARSKRGKKNKKKSEEPVKEPEQGLAVEGKQESYQCWDFKMCMF